MGTLTKGDIVLFPFPYTDLTNRKLRPCLVISEEMGEDIILCQITSQKIEKDQYTVELKQKDMVDGNLMVDSYVRCNMLFTCCKEQILKKVCKIKISVYKKVVETINNIILI